MSEATRQQVEELRAYNKRETEKDLDENDPLYPVGEFFHHNDETRGLFEFD